MMSSPSCTAAYGPLPRSWTLASVGVTSIKAHFIGQVESSSSQLQPAMASAVNHKQRVIFEG